jgi:SAM-dependent methyltransferase
MNALTEFLGRLQTSLADGTFVGLSLTTPGPAAAGVERVRARLVELKSGPHLSVVASEARRDTTENLPLAEVEAWVRARLGTAFRGAMLGTTAGDLQLRLPPRGPARLIAHPARQRTAPARVHDRAKPTRLGAAARDWLGALGLIDAEGRPRPGRGPKLAQLERYLELLEHLLRELGPAEPAAGPLRVVDVGSGRGALTFGAWHLLRRVLARPALVTGVEAREDLVRAASAEAAALGCEGLRFQVGDIASVDLPPADVLIALHACDTATDHAIRRGVAAGARLIVVAPCCHRQVRPQLRAPEPLAWALEHGILAERFAELATDALRVLWLEASGYRVKAIEFVGSEHTPKNLMIAAVRAGGPGPGPARVDAFRACFGIGDQALGPPAG